jgi:hypothetical protein
MKQFDSAEGLSNPLNVSFPELNIFESNYTKGIADIRQQSLQMKELAKRSQQNSVIYQSLSHKIAHDLAQNELDIIASGISTTSWQYVMIILTMLGTVGLAVGYFMLYQRVKVLSAALLLLQRPTLAHASTIDPAVLLLQYIKNQPTNAPKTEATFVFQPEISENMHIPDIITAILIAGLWLHVAYKLYRAWRAEHTFQLVLEVGNQARKVTIPLMKLRHHPDFYSFSAKTFLSHLSVFGWSKPQLCIKWHEFQIKHKITHLIYALDELHDISYYQAWRLREILNSSYYVLMWAKHSKACRYELIKLTDSDWSRIMQKPVDNGYITRLATMALYPRLPAYQPPALEFEDSGVVHV